MPTNEEIQVLKKLKSDIEYPSEELPKGNNRDLHCVGWGIQTWGDLFSERQMFFLNIYLVISTK